MESITQRENKIEHGVFACAYKGWDVYNFLWVNARKDRVIFHESGNRTLLMVASLRYIILPRSTKSLLQGGQ